MRIMLNLAALLICSTGILIAQGDQTVELHNWSQWRGPLATGVALAGNPPIEWNEDKIIKINDVSFRVVHPITRCKATSVNPDTAISDINVPLMLRKGVNHLYMGIYIEALEDGKITPGDKLTVTVA